MPEKAAMLLNAVDHTALSVLSVPLQLWPLRAESGAPQCVNLPNCGVVVSSHVTIALRISLHSISLGVVVISFVFSI